MCGYCATGSSGNATAPASVIRIASTEAKIGRAMKKSTKARRSYRTDRSADPQLAFDHGNRLSTDLAAAAAVEDAHADAPVAAHLGGLRREVLAAHAIEQPVVREIG